MGECMTLHNIVNNKWILMAAMVLAASPAFAKTKTRVRPAPQTQNKTINIDQQLGSLGDNQEIIEKARALQPNNTMKIVQRRQVDRDLRLELGLSYGYVAGGDTYITTQNLGANLDFHITPRWSIGARYIDNRNSLTPEGQRIFDAAAAKQSGVSVPDVDFPLSTYMAVVNFYPVYGKVSWFESSVSQFDLYLLAGAGQVKLTSGTSAVYTAGVGMGVWWNSWFTSRFEARYQNYKDKVYTGERSIDALVMNVGIGFLL